MIQVNVLGIGSRPAVRGRVSLARSAFRSAEVRRPVVAGDHGLAIDQERRGLEAERGIDDGREAVGPYAVAVKQRTREPSRRTINR